MFNRNCCCNRQMWNAPAMGGFMNQPMPTQSECPITEPTITKCVEKEFYHQVPQV